MKESRRSFIKKSTGATATIMIPGISSGKSYVAEKNIKKDDYVSDNEMNIKILVLGMFESNLKH